MFRGSKATPSPHARTARHTHPLPPLDISAMVACALLVTLLVVAQPVSAFVAPALRRPTKSSIVWPSTAGSSQSRGGKTSSATVRDRSCTSMTPEQFAGGDGGNPRPLPDDPAELAVSVAVVPFRSRCRQLFTTTVYQALISKSYAAVVYTR